MLQVACKGAETAQAPASADAVASPTPQPSATLAYVCPMDRDIRSNGPGKCPRCGMALVAGIPDPTEYHLDLDRHAEAGHSRTRQVRLTFEVFDPWKDRPGREIHGRPREALSRLHRQPRPAVLRARPSHVGERRVPLRHRVSEARHVPHPRRLLSRSGGAAAHHRHDLRRRTRDRRASAAVARLFDEGRRESEGRVVDQPCRTRSPASPRRCASASTPATASRNISARGVTCWPPATT